MIIDKPARIFFSDRRVLEKIDYLNEAVKAFADDLAERRLKWLRNEISLLAQKCAPNWEYQSSLTKDPRYIGIGWRGMTNKWPSSLRVEFSWNASHECGRMPADPWIGVSPETPARTKNSISGKVKHLFASSHEQGGGYAIFEYVKDWPNLNECDWVDLYPLIDSNGVAVLQPLVDQIGQIAAVLA